LRASGVGGELSVRSIAGSSNTRDTRCGTAGNPTTLLRALLQFAIIEGRPGPAIVAGAVNSAISSFG
jgi:hypothetical protein